MGRERTTGNLAAFTGYIELFHLESIFSSLYSRDETCTKDPVLHLLNFAIMHVYHKNDGQSIHLCVSKVKKTGINIALDLSVEYYINSFYRNEMFKPRSCRPDAKFIVSIHPN